MPVPYARLRVAFVAGALALGCGGGAPAAGGTTPAPACRAPGEAPSSTDCGYVVAGCCYATSEDACAAAGCALDACLVLESFPAQIRCGAPAEPATSEAAGTGGAAKQDSTPTLTSATATRAGERIVRMARRMVRRRTIVRGSCFDYVDRVFDRAGFDAEDRSRVFSSPIEGPYADLSLIAPGDWLFIVTHPEREPPSTHSVIFVRWLDRAAGRAEVASYAGGDARRPGGLVPYDLTRTYRITRATGRPWH